MKGIHLLGITAAMSALLIFAAAKVDAQQRMGGGGFGPTPGGIGGGIRPSPMPVGGGPRFLPPRSHSGHQFNGFFPGFFVYDREVIHYVEREPEPRADPPPVAPAPPAPPRKPYVIGKSYAELPGPCMKMIEDGASYYHCSGKWYRQVGSKYQAVARSGI